MDENKKYDKILSPKEISEIEEEDLRNIRSKYWKLRHDAFLSEDIPECDLDKVIEELFMREEAELNLYRKNKEKL